MIDFTLMKHQEEALYKSSFTPDMFLAFEMGTGKSCTTIQMIRARSAERGRLCKTLILAPLIVLKNWKKEFALFSKIDQNSIHILQGPIKKRTDFVHSQLGYSCIFITNYDSMQDETFVKKLKEWGPEILVCDESHNLKSYKSVRAKNVTEIARVCTNRYMLTGTPILNNSMDLFKQYDIMDGHLGNSSTFPGNFFVFRARYFEDENAAWSSKPGYFPKWVPKEHAYPELMEKISKKTLRVTKKECLDLPPLVVQNVDVELGKDQLTSYKEMQKDYVTWVSDELNRGVPKAVVARLAVTKALRLQQIVSGFVNTEDGTAVRFKKVPRLDALRDLLEIITPTDKVIVWCCFKENYKMIAEVCKELGIGYREIHGDISNQDKYKSQEEFNNDDSVRVLVGNQSAGGVGISLVSATYSIYYSRGFRLSDDLQSEARNHRRGSEIHDKITRINLVSVGTVDELISEALANKLDISEKILDFNKQIGGANAN